MFNLGSISSIIPVRVLGIQVQRRFYLKGKPPNRPINYLHLKYHQRKILKQEAFGPVSTPKRVGRRVRGGSEEIRAKIDYPAFERVHRTGFHHSQTSKFVHIKEMIPEFIVPDLKDCELKPYVPWAVEDAKQAKLTSRDLFLATYGKQIKEGFEAGKIKTMEDAKDILENKTAVTEKKEDSDK